MCVCGVCSVLRWGCGTGVDVGVLLFIGIQGAPGAKVGHSKEGFRSDGARLEKEGVSYAIFC